MPRVPSVLAFGLALVALWIGTGPSNAQGSLEPIGTLPAPAASDPIPVSPVLLYTAAGGTLTGYELDQVSIDSSGLVVMSRISEIDGERGVRIGQVPPLRVLELGRTLHQLGAHELDDQTTAVADAPLRTLSLASSTGPNVRMHSYSYWFPTGQHALVEDALEQWMLDEGLLEAPPR